MLDTILKWGSPEEGTDDRTQAEGLLGTILEWEAPKEVRDGEFCRGVEALYSLLPTPRFCVYLIVLRNFESSDILLQKNRLTE
jgi:hypothetical protein